MKEKNTTGANDSPKLETIAQTGEGLPDDSGAIIDVASDGEAKIREDIEKGPAQPKPPTGPTVDDEDPDYSPMDDRERIDTEQDGLGLTRCGPNGSVIEERHAIR